MAKIKPCLFLTSLLIVPSVLLAADLSEKEKQLIERCNRYIEMGEQESAQSILSGIAVQVDGRKKGNYSKDFLETLEQETKKCVEFAYGPGAGFHPDIARFHTKDGAKEIIETRNRTAQEKEAKIQKEAEEAQKRFQKLQLRLHVYKKVYQACSKLAKRDEVLAFTNELCVESFLANGLPD